VRSQEGNEGIAQGVELVLGGGLEQRHGGQVDGLGRVGLVANDDGLGGTLIALGIDGAEEVFGVGEIGVLLCPAQTSAAVRLILAAGLVGASFQSSLLPVFLYPLGLGLLVCCGFGLGLGGGFFGLLSLLALYLGVFTGIP
jgi:hypothetical protein